MITYSGIWSIVCESWVNGVAPWDSLGLVVSTTQLLNAPLVVVKLSITLALVGLQKKKKFPPYCIAWIWLIGSMFKKIILHSNWPDQATKLNDNMVSYWPNVLSILKLLVQVPQWSLSSVSPITIDALLMSWRTIDAHPLARMVTLIVHVQAISFIVVLLTDTASLWLLYLWDGRRIGWVEYKMTPLNVCKQRIVSGI